MRVLQIGKYYPPEHGGMETHLADLCQKLKHEVDLEVVVSNKSPVSQTDNVDGVVVERLATPMHVLGNPVNPALVRRIQHSKADIVHLHWPNPLGLLAYLASRNPAPLVLTYHSDIVRQKLSGGLFRPILEMALRKATVLVTSPNYMESSPVLHKFQDRCHVVPLGIEAERYRRANPERVREFRQRYGNKMIFATGRHVSYKGFEYLVKAMAHVDGHLVLGGDGPLRTQLQELAASLGVSERITFTGRLSDGDMEALYAACSVFCLPSVERSEAFGLVQLEAMAAGKPVVNTDVNSGVPYVSLHEKTGLTVPRADANSLAKALTRLLREERQRRIYGENASARVDELFTVERMAANTLRVYREVLGQSERAPAALASAV